MIEIAYRWSGAMLMIGAAMLGVAIVIVSFKPVMGQIFSPMTSLLFLFSSIFLLLSLPAMYAKQANTADWLGLIGYALLQTGVLLLVIIAATPILYPSIKSAPGENIVVFLLGIALTLGLLLTGIATFRADIFPRWAGVLMIAATAGFFFDFFIAEFLPPLAGQIGAAIFGMLIALALAWIGIVLWIGKLG